jgi:hypothetical protein
MKSKKTKSKWIKLRNNAFDKRYKLKISEIIVTKKYGIIH